MSVLDVTQIKVTEPTNISTLFIFDLPVELRARSGAELQQGTPLHDKLVQEVSYRISQLENVLEGSVVVEPRHIRVMMIDATETLRAQTLKSIKSVLSHY